MSTQSTICPELHPTESSTDRSIQIAPSWNSSTTSGATIGTVKDSTFAEITRPTITDDNPTLETLPVAFLDSETVFYGQYSWCLNPFLTLQEAVQYLTCELKRLDEADGWQYSEVLTNIFLLSCAITDTVDDYLLGPKFDFSKLANALAIAAPGVRIIHKLLEGRSNMRALLLGALRRWRNDWANAVTDFCQHAIIAGSNRDCLEQCEPLTRLLPAQFLKNLGQLRTKVPAFFRSRDFAVPDCLELARKVVAESPNSDRPAIVVGLRTAGSFLAPLVCAYLRSRGTKASWIAIRPAKGLAPWEKRELDLASKDSARPLIADESVHSGQTLGKSINLLCKAGFKEEDIVVLNPVEPALPDWRKSRLFQSLSKVNVVTLESPARYKVRFLESRGEVQRLLSEYFSARGYSEVRVVSSPTTEELNSNWRNHPPERVDHRLKRIYEVHLKDASGSGEIRYVLAKSVGWGWLGYHAFISGQRLAKWTPPIIGMREGVLFLQWFPKNTKVTVGSDREEMIESLASYLATRTKTLCLKENPVLDLVNEDRHKGVELLANYLGRAYGSRLVAAIKRPQLRRMLAGNNEYVPVMTDSKMGIEEWICAAGRTAKVDFEHHCFGKNELCITDPAFDLASAIFYFELSDVESQRLISRYVEESGDKNVEPRLFFNKLLAGIRAQSLADHDIHHPRLFAQRSAANRHYIAGWNFLVGESVRECGRLCVHPDRVHWHTPLVVADIDGVLDRMVFGFPCTTAAGIKAISLLHLHGFCIALNTARTLQEVKDYCRAYGFAGGVAEYGAVLWDATSDRECVLADRESLEQLRAVRDAFCKIPGCFLNDDYQYSLRVFTYQDGRTAPVPQLLARDLLASLHADRLSVHQTGLDTAITAKHLDKGSGLLALLDFCGLPKGDVVAIGDSEPDLAMFRVATRSFAPGNVTCRREAQLLGCSIAASSYQPGLLEIATRIVHPKGGICDRCNEVELNWPKEKGLFLSLLEAADQRPLSLLLKNFQPSSLLAPFKK